MVKTHMSPESSNFFSLKRYKKMQHPKIKHKDRGTFSLSNCVHERHKHTKQDKIETEKTKNEKSD